MKQGWLSSGVICASLLLAVSARAQDANDGTLHVLRPVIHAEQEEAEFCLEFDHDLDAADHGHIASSVKLESAGKGIPIKPQNISAVNNLLCLPSLEHHKQYRIVVSGIRGSKNEKLANSYGLDFTVPDRKPALSFTGNAEDEGMTRWQDNDPVLRSINVPRVHLELYRITDPAMMIAAWRDRQQTTLAPSESATFGHDHGQEVWSGDLALGDTLNKTAEHPAPLRDAVIDAPSGLYLIVARAPETKTDTETEAGATGLATTGAAWLLRSSLRLQALRDTGGFYGFTEKSDASASLGSVRILAADANGQTLAEIRTDTNGVGFMPLAADRINNAAVLVGFTNDGDIDFADLSAHVTDRFAPPENHVSLTADKAFYFPASQASVLLAAYDAQGHAVLRTGATLALMWPDGSSYMSIPVPADASAHLAFPVPAVTGTWPLVWRQSNGDVLAQASIRVTADPIAPRLEMSADRAIASRDGDVNLTLKSITGDGKPVPYVAGRVFVAWSSPDTLFKEWKDYHFGNGRSPASSASPLISFVTNEKGVVSLHAKLTPPDDHALLHSAVVSVQGDAAEGIAVPAPLTFSLKPKENIVGIKPLASDGRFPENGFARFAVVTLDPEGHRQDAADLTYQVYEEGRSFDWYQAEGRWNYKPLQQKRRIGGGALKLGTDGDDIIEWPVAAGSYRLEITDANGVVRASTDFSAGWGLPETSLSHAPLDLTPSSPEWRPGKEVQVRFTLDKPSMIDAYVGDDHVRKVIHRFLPAGENDIAFMPEKEWGEHLSLRVESDALNLAGQLVLPRVDDTPDVMKPDVLKDIQAPEALTIGAEFPSVLMMGDTIQASLVLHNNGKTQETWHYAVSAAAGMKITDSVAVGSVTIPGGQSRKIPLGLNAVHAGSSTVKLDITGASRFHASREWAIPVMAGDIKFGPAVRQRIEPQQSTSWPPNEKTHAKDESILFLSSTPLYNAPALLTDILDGNAFTSREIVGVLETLRLWRGTIISAGLISEAEIDIRERNALMRLLARQTPDGGFSFLPTDKADFTSTSEALVALAHSDPAIAKPALEHAAGWLRQRLENTWFDEHERPERAAAYAALAEAGRLDNASLHYFSDTSAQKTLPLLAAAQLAFAFAKIGDQPASSFWIHTSGVKKDLSALPSAILPVLGSNAFFDAQTLLPSLEALSNKNASHNFAGDVESATDILRAAWMVQNRKGAWSVTVNTDKRNPRDILVVSVPAKTVAPIIHNTGNEAIFLSGVQRVTASLSGGEAATRSIYQLNGTELGGNKPLGLDETYLVILEGSWSGSATDALLLHDDPGPGLHVTGCLPPAPIEADDSLAWLKNQTLTTSMACETSADGIDIILTRKDGEGKENTPWRAAYLAKARTSGTFTLQPVSAYAFTPDHGVSVRTSVTKESRDQIKIR